MSASGELRLGDECEKRSPGRGYMMRDEEKEGGFSFGGRAVGIARRPVHDMTRCSATVCEGLFIGIGDEWSMQGQRSPETIPSENRRRR